MRFLTRNPKWHGATANQPTAEVPESQTPAHRRRILAGLLVRKPCWRLSLWGRLLALVLLTGVFLGVFYSIYPWLAVTHRIPSRYLIVEGWIHRSGIEQAILEFHTGGYRRILTSGCTVPDPWNFRGASTYADWGASRLEKLGMPKNLVESVPNRVDRTDRTYHSALAVKAWFRDHHIAVTRIDVVSMGPHARRTRLLYQEAFGNTVAVGVIATADGTYDPRHWWRSSEGVREVIGEAIAYVYAKFLFYPSASGRNP